MSKNQTDFDKRSLANTKKIYLRKCKNCEQEVLMSKNQDYCSPYCKGFYKYKTRKVTTDSQYHAISGNWKRYCSRLLYFGGRRRDKLTVDILLQKLKEQDYKCALTGVNLTCTLSKGVITKTNASVDRIIAGGPYTIDNIQIVCRAVNSWRADLTVNEFVEWCRKVVDYNNVIKEQ